MSEGQSQSSPPTVVGYGHSEGRPVAEILASGTPTSPPIGRLVVAMVVGLFPLTYPLAVWAAVPYWQAPLSQRRWRAVSLVLLAMGLFNVVGFLAYGYGRHFSLL
jgi:hypothetical protein